MQTNFSLSRALKKFAQRHGRTAQLLAVRIPSPCAVMLSFVRGRFDIRDGQAAAVHVYNPLIILSTLSQDRTKLEDFPHVGHYQSYQRFVRSESWSIIGGTKNCGAKKRH